MKIKMDENLPTEIADSLRADGHDIHTVMDESLAGRDDSMVFQAAAAEDRVLLTQDLDFSDIRHFRAGTHAGIVLVRLGNPSRKRLMERVRQVFSSEAVESWSRCFVVISDRKLRIRRP